MKAVKTRARFQCDFCKRRSTKSVMELHEKRCYRNPNRFCDYCENKGHITEEYGDGMSNDIPCNYCAKFDAKMKEEIEAREKNNL